MKIEWFFPSGCARSGLDEFLLQALRRYLSAVGMHGVLVVVPSFNQITVWGLIPKIVCKWGQVLKKL